MAREPGISISIVSHNQSRMVKDLVHSIQKVEDTGSIEIIITENLPSEEALNDLEIPNLSKLKNPKPLGFAANQNNAFRRARGTYFCILNPDVILIEPVFHTLITDIEQNHGDILAPLVVNSNNEIQDSFRALPTPMSILKRLIVSSKPRMLPVPEGPIYPDWVAGIMLIMHRDVFSKLGGFDERYRMYFEDVDFCSRARLAGHKVMLEPNCRIVHDAQRLSHRDPSLALKHFTSAVRFFSSAVYRQVRA